MIMRGMRYGASPAFAFCNTGIFDLICGIPGNAAPDKLKIKGIMKKSILKGLALCAFMAMGTMAAHADEALVIQKAGGVDCVYFLGDKPMLRFAGDLLIVDAPKGSIEHRMGDIVSAQIQDRELSVITEAGAGSFVFAFDGRNIRIAGMQPKAEVAVTGLDGIKKLNSMSDASGIAEMDCSALEPGIYVVTLPGQTLKIKK